MSILHSIVVLASLPLASLPVALAAQEPVAPAKPAPPSPPVKGDPINGPLSEEAFKALHVLKEGAAPKLMGSMVDVPDAGKAYLSLPKGAKAPLPAVIVIHEWWGLNDHVKHWADRVAALGYAALAVDLYDGRVATTSDDAMKLTKVDEEKTRGRLKAAHAFLVADPRVRATKTASIGWCFGGRWSLETAIAIPDLDACVIYYGRPITDVATLEKVKAPILGIFGTKDGSIPPAKVEEFDKALTAAKVEHAFHSYEAEHAFANPSGARYDEKSAADAFEKVKAFLASRLGG